jgi:hypothetical protein
MTKNPVLGLSLTQVMRSEIALPLQHVLQVYTVGNFLNAWRNPKSQKCIEQCFDSPQQARHAASTCAAWLGLATPPTLGPVPAWWLVEADPGTLHS